MNNTNNVQTKWLSIYYESIFFPEKKNNNSDLKNTILF